MNAIEAYLLSEKNLNSNIFLEYNMIISTIRNAANKGKFFIIVTELYPENITTLRLNGYTVEYNNHYRISWNKS